MAESDAILNRLLDLQGTDFEVVDCKVSEEKIVWRVRHRQGIYECPRCHAKLESCHVKRWITLKDTPFGTRQCLWQVERAQVLCTCSNNLRVEYMPFRAGHHHLTQRFVDQIEQVLCSKMFTVADVARLFNVDFGTVYKIDHDVLLRLWQSLEIPAPKNISVDEKSYKKGHNYVTIVTDVDLGKVVWGSEGHKKESLDMFFQVLGEDRCQQIKTVSKDLHKPYALSCQDYIPQAIEVADPFHVVKKLNECMDQCRKELAVESKTKPTKRKKIFRLNWVLGHKQEDMKEHHQQSLEELAKLNEPHFHAYLHKEAFYEFFLYHPSEVEEANKFLISWITEAFKSKLKGLQSSQSPSAGIRGSFSI